MHKNCFFMSFFYARVVVFITHTGHVVAEQSNAVPSECVVSPLSLSVWVCLFVCGRVCLNVVLFRQIKCVNNAWHINNIDKASCSSVRSICLSEIALNWNDSLPRLNPSNARAQPMWRMLNFSHNHAKAIERTTHSHTLAHTFTHINLSVWH